jgi:signal transduction histidine kinase
MILLVTASSRAKECAAALETSARQKVDVAHSVSRALAKLQQTEYDALVVDESLVEIDDGAVNALLNHAGMAMPIYINLGLHRTERLVREVIAGLMRKHAEHLGARRSAITELQSQLRGDLTGILLASELALRESSIPPRVADRINSVHRLAEQIRTRLEVAAM